MPYRALFVVKKPIVVLCWIGLVNSATWSGFGMRAAVRQSSASAAATARAVDQLDRQIDQLRIESMDTRETVAALGERVGGVIVRIDTLYGTMLEMKVEARNESMEQRRMLSTMLMSVLGFFITVTGALIAVLWSIRKGWLRTADARD